MPTYGIAIAEIPQCQDMAKIIILQCYRVANNTDMQFHTIAIMMLSLCQEMANASFVCENAPDEAWPCRPSRSDLPLTCSCRSTWTSGWPAGCALPRSPTISSAGCLTWWMSDRGRTRQLRTQAEGPERPHPLRIHLQGPDLRAELIHPRPDPPDAGTEQPSESGGIAQTLPKFAT